MMRFANTVGCGKHEQRCGNSTYDKDEPPLGDGVKLPLFSEDKRMDYTHPGKVPAPVVEPNGIMRVLP